MKKIAWFCIFLTFVFCGFTYSTIVEEKKFFHEFLSISSSETRVEVESPPHDPNANLTEKEIEECIYSWEKSWSRGLWAEGILLWGLLWSLGALRAQSLVGE